MLEQVTGRYLFLKAWAAVHAPGLTDGQKADLIAFLNSP